MAKIGSYGWVCFKYILAHTVRVRVRDPSSLEIRANIHFQCRLFTTVQF